MSEAAAAAIHVNVQDPIQAAPAPAEAPPADGAQAEAPKPSASKSFAAAARRERAVQRQREEISSARAAVAAEKAAVDAKARELEAKYGGKPGNPLEALKRYGWSYKDATEFALNDSQPTAEQIARAAVSEVESLKAQRQSDVDAAKLAQQQAAERDAQEATQEFQEEIASFVKEKPQDYELINLHNAEATVYAVIEAHFEKTKAAGKPRVLSIKEGADLVERYLEKQAERILGTSKIKARLSPPGDPKQPQGQAQAQQRRTLSNGMTPSTPALASLPSSSAEQTPEQRAMARAIAALS